jgi:flagellar biogenesis protein FliO
MLIAALAMVAALAFVLGLGAVALWALRRFGGGALGRRTRLAVEVVQKVPLGPKTQLAVVRVGEKVMAVSMGDGGVRPLFELAPEDRDRVLASSQVPVPLASSETAQAQIAQAQIAQAHIAKAHIAKAQLAQTQIAPAQIDQAPSAPAAGAERSPLPAARHRPAADAAAFEAALARTLAASRMAAEGSAPPPTTPLPARTRPARPRFAADEPREVPGFLTAPRRVMDPGRRRDRAATARLDGRRIGQVTGAAPGARSSPAAGTG